jgi:N-formylglutamate amidohydrolase
MWTIEYDTTRLVARHRGTLPVILACPHGGEDQPPGVPRRSGDGLPSLCQFSRDGDVDSAVVATALAQRILEISGEAPYVVLAEYHRRYIDANRPRECAYEVAEAEPFYDEYHDTLRAFVDDVRAENGGLGLLFDLHGTEGIPGDPTVIFLGTNDGRTVARLLAADAQALTRRRGFPGLLRESGYVVAPAPGQPDPPFLRGGHTVRTYGSAHADGLDAIQVELTRPLRSDPELRAELVDRLAHAIVSAAARYADLRTLSAIHSLRLLGGGVVYEPDSSRPATNRDGC